MNFRVVYNQFWFYSPSTIVFRHAPTTQRLSLIWVYWQYQGKILKPPQKFPILGMLQAPGNNEERYCLEVWQRSSLLYQSVMWDIAHTPGNSTSSITFQVPFFYDDRTWHKDQSLKLLSPSQLSVVLSLVLLPIWYLFSAIREVVL